MTCSLGYVRGVACLTLTQVFTYSGIGAVSVLQALGITMMPLGLLLHRAASVAGGFAPFGTYCLMLSDAISVIDSIAQPKLLQTTGAQLFKVVQNVGESRGAAPLIVQRFLTDHDIQSYKDVLQNVLQNPSALGKHVTLCFQASMNSGIAVASANCVFNPAHLDPDDLVHAYLMNSSTILCAKLLPRISF